ncbi:hypothetical protein LCGC14_0362070 [marine sediment metagenome]|uniref:Uncharacterized protein n=1 Tax=marine sediment metagenome TaxID=412755 RepID=A0A0F9TDH5_9ZZZZ
MGNQVQETGMERFRRLQKEAKALGITGQHNANEFEALIAQAKAEFAEPVEPIAPEKPVGSKLLVGTGLTVEEAAKIDAELRYRHEAEEKFKVERQKQLDYASIVAEADSLKIEIDLPENPTELQLAKARRKLGIEKTEVRPSPETVGIESSKRGYYIFTNREQEDALQIVNLGGKYTINLIPEQVHVLSEYHVKTWKRFAVTPVYERVSTGVVASPNSTGEFVEECKRTGSKPRFIFEYLGEAPADAPFGLVLDREILDKVMPKEESFA